jgi:hypothetical protein
LEEARAESPGAGHGARRRLLAWVVPAALALWTFPSVTPPGSAGLDGAWILEINRLAASRHHFGPGVAFTYGPLGRLLYPVDMGSHLLQASLLRIAFAVAFALGLVRLARRAGSPWVLAGAPVAQLAAFALGLDSRYFGFEYQLMLVLPLLAWEALEARSAAGLAAAAAAAVLAFFAKTTLGVGWMAAVGTAAALAALRRDWRLPVAAAAAGAATLAAAARLLFPSPGDLLPWLRASLELAGGYSEAMSLGGTWGLTLGGAAALLAFLGLCAWLVIRRSPAGSLALLFAAPAFLAYKHGFVRQDALHTAIFFTYLAAVLGLLALAAGSGRGRSAALAGAALAVVLAVPARHRHPDHAGFPWRALAGVAGAANAAAWATLAPIRREQASRDLTEVTAPGLRPVTGDDLGVVPWQLGYCYANGIDCVPNPTLQTFAAYTHGLDRATALHYAGPSAPGFVLVSDDALADKSVALEAPATWRALVECYRPAAAQPARDLLLARRPGACSRPETPQATATARFGEWVAVPFSQGPVSVAVPLDLGWPGRAVKAIHRLPAVHLELALRSGRTRRIRLAPDTARNGLPLDLAPDGAADLARVFRGELPPDRAERIRLSGPGARWYREPLEIAFMATAP